MSSASGTTSRTRATRSSRRCEMRTAWSCCCLTASSTAAAKRAIAGTSMVPERMSRSCPPPCSSGGHVELAAYDERSDAVRTAELVRGEGHRVDPGLGEVDGHLADCLDGVGVDRDAVRVRDLDDLGERLQRADLVVGPHHAHQRDALGSRSMAGRNCRASALRTCVTGSSSTSAPSWSASHCSGSSTAWCSMAADQHAGPPRVRVAPGPVDALEREVVGLGAAGGEDDLAGARADALGDGLAGLLDTRRARCGPTRAARRRCRCAGARSVITAEHLVVHRGRRRVVEVDGPALERVFIADTSLRVTRSGLGGPWRAPGIRRPDPYRCRTVNVSCLQWISPAGIRFADGSSPNPSQ